MYKNTSQERKMIEVETFLFSDRLVMKLGLYLQCERQTSPRQS